MKVRLFEKVAYPGPKSLAEAFEPCHFDLRRAKKRKAKKAFGSWKLIPVVQVIHVHIYVYM